MEKEGERETVMDKRWALGNQLGRLGMIWPLKDIKMVKKGAMFLDDVIFGMNEVKNSPADGGKHRSVDHGHIF